MTVSGSQLRQIALATCSSLPPKVLIADLMAAELEMQTAIMAYAVALLVPPPLPAEMSQGNDPVHRQAARARERERADIQTVKEYCGTPPSAMAALVATWVASDNALYHCQAAAIVTRAHPYQVGEIPVSVVLPLLSGAGPTGVIIRDRDEERLRLIGALDRLREDRPRHLAPGAPSPVTARAERAALPRPNRPPRR